MVALCRRIQRHEEAALRRHHLEGVARLQCTLLIQLLNTPPRTLRTPTRSSPSSTPAQML